MSKRLRGPLVLEEIRERDPEGRIVVHHRVVDTLARMRQAGTIDAAMLDAGRKFQRSFIRAQLNPLRAADLMRVPGSSRVTEPGDSQLTAGRQVRRALAALGGPASPAGSCAWHVLGSGCSVRNWALCQGWGGRSVPIHQAHGVLLATLGLLATHYRLAAPLRPSLVPLDHVPHKM